MIDTTTTPAVEVPRLSDPERLYAQLYDATASSNDMRHWTGERGYKDATYALRDARRWLWQGRGVTDRLARFMDAADYAQIRLEARLGLADARHVTLVEHGEAVPSPYEDLATLVAWRKAVVGR